MPGISRPAGHLVAAPDKFRGTADAAQAAAAAGKFDDAVKLANDAEALANASIAQAKEQETAWTQAVVR